MSFDVAVGDLAHAVGRLVRRVRTAAASSGISWTESSVLNRLAKYGPSTTAELARTQGMKPQSMGTVIAGLEEMGLVERKPHATDGRRVNLELTEKGAALQKSTSDTKRAWLAKKIATLSEEEQRTLFAAGALMERLVEEEAQ
jgi:DNA-binding MarR family transcriptional regulator